MQKITGKVALVTGAGRGIGQGIAMKLAHEGARVVVNDFDGEQAEHTVAAIIAAGGSAVACSGDVTSSAFAEEFVATALEQYSGIDIIVNNAGYLWPQAIHKMSEEQFRALLDVHLTGPFLILRAATEPMREFAKAESRAGQETFRKVVNISSLVGLYGESLSVNYAASKAGVIGMTRALAKEWGRYRINVNCVAFGMIDTRLTSAEVAAAPELEISGRRVNIGSMGSHLETVEHTIPLGRKGTVEEAAGAVYLFCTPESNYITGQVLLAGGGLLG